jgi:uncharacterized OsmC-like protein
MARAAPTRNVATAAPTEDHHRAPAPTTTDEELPMSNQTVTAERRNGVDIATIFATTDAVAQQPELGQFQFRAHNRWVSGAHSRSSSQGFHGAGQEHEHTRSFVFGADHPAVLVGNDEGPAPVEYLLYALAFCITAGVANVAAARGVTLTRVESTLEGDIDVRGIFGLSDEVRNGYQQVRMRIHVEGDADRDTLRSIVGQSRARSAVYDVLTNGVSVELDVVA